MTPTASQRRIWLATERRRQALERGVRRQLALRFQQEGQAVVAAYRRERWAGIVEAMHQQVGRWRTVYQGIYLTVGMVSAADLAATLFPGKKAWKAAGDQQDADDELEHALTVARLGRTERAVLGYLQTTAGARIAGIQETTLKRLRARLAEAYADGATTDEMVAALVEVYGQWARGRAEAIARTEVLVASERGAFEMAKASGLRMDKTWIATMDDRVRDSHAAANGQTVELEQPFLVRAPRGAATEELLVPGDASRGATAGNIINCRCAVGYRPRRRSTRGPLTPAQQADVDAAIRAAM